MGMRNPHILICLLLFLAPVVRAYDIPGFTPDQIVPFKQTINSTGGAVTLNLHVFTPPGHKPSHQRPAIVFFFGGGWVDGSASHFHPQCEYLASRGMVAISAEYRVRDLHGTTPQECVKDGKSAIRYVRQNAATLGVDPNRIAAGGGSAGGHAAAATATLTAYDEPSENLTISSKPNALVLYNPVVDNGPGGYGHTTVQAYWQSISPLHNITGTAPPTCFFLGTSDNLVPVSVGENYRAAMESMGLRCDLHLYQGQPHSFFNYDVPNDSSGPFYGYRDTLFKTDAFLVSLGYLSDPLHPSAEASGWVTLAGNAGFSGGTAATASPVTTDADGDIIAAPIDPTTLTNGQYLRLSGSVTFNAPLIGEGFHIGVFDSANPIAAGVATGYTGIWASAPATAATSIAAANGTGTQPFDVAASTILGPIPAAGTTVPANVPIQFTLTIARNVNKLDVAVQFTSGTTYRASQNLINLTASSYTFDSIAFHMDGNLNATQASFSNIRITRGPVPVDSVPAPTQSDAITYVDASTVTGGNTFLTSNPSNTTWLNATANSATANNTQWVVRSGANDFGINDSLLQSVANSGDFPQITTRLTGMPDGTYTIWAFFWEQVVSTTQNWGISAGLNAGLLTTYSAPLAGHSRPGTNTASVTNAAELVFTTPVKIRQASDGSGGFLQNLFGVNLGQVTVAGGAAVDVFIDNNLVGTSSWRVWHDGVGYQRMGENTSQPTTRPLLGVDFNRSDTLGAPSQSMFRVVSGSATSPAANSSSYTKIVGNHQITISQPDGSNFEFRGANGDSTRAIPGGDTSLSFLVADFITTRKGVIDIKISGLAAGDYRFRSWHLDTLTSSALGFAQGINNTTPNLIEAQVGGLTRAAVEPTALGSAGLNTTFIHNSQIPTLDFPIDHDGSSPLTIRLRAIDWNGVDRFLLLNGFAIYPKNP
jgi:acetyl esterase